MCALTSDHFQEVHIFLSSLEGHCCLHIIFRFTNIIKSDQSQHPESDFKKHTHTQNEQNQINFPSSSPATEHRNVSDVQKCVISRFSDVQKFVISRFPDAQKLVTSAWSLLTAAQQATLVTTAQDIRL